MRVRGWLCLPGWIDSSYRKLGKETIISPWGSPFPLSVPLFGADNRSLQAHSPRAVPGSPLAPSSLPRPRPAPTGSPNSGSRQRFVRTVGLRLIMIAADGLDLTARF